MRRGFLVLAVVGLLAAGVQWARATVPPVTVDVEHVYDGCGTMGTMGALRMVMADLPMNYEHFLRYADPARVYVHEGSLGPALQRLGYRARVDASDEGLRQVFLDDMAPQAEVGESFSGPEAALQALRRELQAGRPGLVALEQAAITPDREAAWERFHPGTADEAGEGPVVMVVVGLGSGRVFLHDPELDDPAAERLPVDLERFLEGWEEQGHLLFRLERVGAPQPPEEALRAALATARASQQEWDSLAQSILEREGGFEEDYYALLLSVRYRREVLAAWLQEIGHTEAAAAYRGTLPLYDGFHEGMTVDEAVDLIDRVAVAEAEAAALIRQ